jgi:arylsulfatase A-like enzyme
MASSSSLLPAQAVYPAIRLDSTALASKMAYLDAVSLSRDPSARPNIIIILVDDLGKHDITLYDSSGVETIHINQLAKEGVVFTHAYSTSAVCNPSRAGLITGRYPQRFGGERQMMTRYAKNKMEYFVFKHCIDTRPMYLTDPWYSPGELEICKQGLPESEITLFEILHHAGYETACIGKWHLGYHEPFHPHNRKVDYFFGFYEAFTLYVPKAHREMVNYRHRNFQNRHIWRQKRKGPSAIMQNGQEVEVDEYLTLRFAEEACRYIRQHENNPFLLYLPFNAPHTPFQAPKDYCDKFSHISDKNKRVYFGMIAALDDAVGMILEQVKESGLEENTLVFFTSDNGGATYTGATTNGALNGGKITPFEGGLNVPLVMKWNGKLAPGVYTQPVSLLDIFSTTIAACRIPPPATIVVDGVDVIPFLTGENPGAPREYLCWRTDFNKTIRHGKWKLIQNTRDDLILLFDLEADQQEKYDLKADHPEIVTRLLELLATWESEMKPPAWPGVMEYEEEINGIKMRFAL